MKVVKTPKCVSMVEKQASRRAGEQASRLVERRVRRSGVAKQQRSREAEKQ